MIWCECRNETTGEILQKEFRNSQNFTAEHHLKMWYRYCRYYLLTYGDKYEITVIRKDEDHITTLTKAGTIKRMTNAEKDQRRNNNV